MLTDVLFIFMQKGLDAIALITPLAMGLYGTLVLLDFTWTAIKVALNNGDSMFKTFVLKTVNYGIFYHIIKYYKEIIDQILNSFIKVGLVAGGNVLSKADATNPSYIIDLGYVLMDKMYSFRDLVKSDSPPGVGVQVIVNAVISAAKGELTIAKLFPNLFFWLVSFLIFVAFGLIAIQIFITWVETFLITSAAIIFIPCAVFTPFAFLTEKAIGALIGCGVKLMMLLFIMSISFPILETWQVSVNPDNYDNLKLLSTSAAIAFLCWQSPSMAGSLMSGSPSLTAGTAAGGIGAIAAMAGTAFSMAKMGLNAVQGVGSVAGNMLNGAENTIAAADMAGVGDTGNSVSGPTITTDKSNAPAGGMTAENIASGIDNPPSSTSEPSQNSAANSAAKLKASAYERQN